jgi:hypothetical protein
MYEKAIPVSNCMGKVVTRHCLFFYVCGYRYLASGEMKNSFRTVIMNKQYVAR